MKLITHQCKSRKYKGLLVGFARLEDGSILRLNDKPEGGERIEAKVRTLKAWRKNRVLSIVKQTA